MASPAFVAFDLKGYGAAAGGHFSLLQTEIKDDLSVCAGEGIREHFAGIDCRRRLKPGNGVIKAFGKRNAVLTGDFFAPAASGAAGELYIFPVCSEIAEAACPVFDSEEISAFIGNNDRKQAFAEQRNGIKRRGELEGVLSDGVDILADESERADFP